MRVAFTIGYYDPGIRDPSRYPDRTFTLHYFARELIKTGHHVRIIAPFRVTARFEREGVPYQLIRAPWLSRAVARAAGRVFGGFPFPYYELNTGLLAELRHFEPEVIHFFGLTMDPTLACVSRQAQADGHALVIHYHGGQPATHPLRKRMQAHNLARADAVLFTARAQAEPWIRAGLLAEEGQAWELFENSAHIEPLPHAEAKRVTGMTGQPVFLSVARLVPDKDPLTVVKGFGLIRRQWPEARMYFYYLRDDLEGEMRRLIGSSPDLRGAVSLRGSRAFDSMAALYSSADFLLQASKREHGGQAIMEAMACGVIPIVTDIPSFRRMTAGGRFGRLFQLGDAESLARQVLSYDRRNLPDEKQAIRSHFEVNLSFRALAGELEKIYHAVLLPDRQRVEKAGG